MKQKIKKLKKIKSIEEVILDFQRENIDRISFKPEGRTPLRFSLAEDLKKAGYIHISKTYPLVKSMKKTIAILKSFKRVKK